MGGLLQFVRLIGLRVLMGFIGSRSSAVLYGIYYIETLDSALHGEDASRPCLLLVTQWPKELPTLLWGFLTLILL